MNVENIVVDIEINNSLAPDIEQSIVATTDNNINVIKDNTDDLDVTINRKEYVITGDEIYIPKRYEDAPTWLQNMIDQVVEYSIGAKVSDMNQVVYSLNQMIEAMEVSKNTYEMSVISSNDIDTRINTAITTLNSNMNDADATILSVANTKTTPEEAEAIMINAVRAELESTEAGTIGAAVATLSTAIANEEEARSTSVETLYSTMEGEFEATATAFNTINTYIGIDEAGASTGTGLSAYIEGDDGTFGSAGSELNNQVVATAEKVESKFAYNSTLKINGVPYTSGFGLATSQTVNSGIPEGDSEFWVTADKFKLRAASQTAASQQPFTVNAVTGDITFEGKVTFGSSQSGTIEEAIASTIENIQVGDKNINITDNLIPVTSLVGDINNAGYQFQGAPVKSITSGIDTYAEPQIYISGADEVYSPYIEEVNIPYYYRFGIKGVSDLSNFKFYYIDSSNAVTSVGLTYTMLLDNVVDPLKWYIIEGILNPVGGSTSNIDGTIRQASDMEIVGKINSSAVATGSAKVLLGWAASCIISRMKIAKITADTITGQIVTQKYIDNAIQNRTSTATQDSIATTMGFENYQHMLAQFILLGDTIINGGYINTGLISAAAINADQINTTGLIAENISSNTIDGKTITGAKIIGSVIKASYLDLDGELEVLTNFYLISSIGSISQIPALAASEGRYMTSYVYNSLHDSVPDVSISPAGSIYRIPSLSRVSETPGTVGNGTTLTGRLRAYNQYNTGNSMKAVKRRPIFQNSNFTVATIVRSDNDQDGTVYTYLKLGTIILGRISVLKYSTSNLNQQDFFTVRIDNIYNNTFDSLTISSSGDHSLSIYNIPIFGNITVNINAVFDSYTRWYKYDGDMNIIPADPLDVGAISETIEGKSITVNAECLSGTYELPFDWTDASAINISGAGSYSLSGIAINNMI